MRENCDAQPAVTAGRPNGAQGSGNSAAVFVVGQWRKGARVGLF
jgi:hypothetical protein